MRNLTHFTVVIGALLAIPVCGDDNSDALIKTFDGEFVTITPGAGQFPATFEMGSSAQPSEQPPHHVMLKRSFAIARYEVPQNLYEAVMGENPSRWKGPRNSAEMMTWNEAVAFCEKVTNRMRAAKLIAGDEVIRLPTEAEWEYCCRAGTTTAWSFGDSATAEGDSGNAASLLDPYGWHTGNAAGNDPPVGALKPNPWGLYDMHGYLSEFTADYWHENYEDAPADGSSRVSPAGEGPIVIRGGSWKDHYSDLRSAARKPYAVNARDPGVGFRCVKSSIPSS